MATRILYFVGALLAITSHAKGQSQIPQAMTTVNDLSGCGKLHPEDYTPSEPASLDNSIMVGGWNRTFGIYVPAGYNNSATTPRKLIFDYHGNDGTPEHQYDNSQYYLNDDGQDYIVVYPAGVNKSWESAPYAVPGVSDLNFTTNLLAYIRTEYCIDSNHIYASGKSNGGGFVDYLACSTNGSEFAAFAMASAALYGDNNRTQCATNRTRAIMESHGGNDHIIDYQGHVRKSDGGRTPDVREWIGWWADRDCVNSTIHNSTDGSVLHEYRHISYSCNGYEDLVQHYEVYNLGHCWPIDESQSNWDSNRDYCQGFRTQVLDYTSVVIDFFEKWNLTSFGENTQDTASEEQNLPEREL